VGLLVAVLGLVFGLVNYMRVAKLPVHPSMREVSQLIWETCKTYLVTQGKFLLILEIFIGIIILLYFGVLLGFEALRVAVILAFSLVGIAGSYGVAWFGIRINTQANSRTAFASLAASRSALADTARGGDEHRDGAHKCGTLCHALHPSLRPGDWAGPCFIGFAIGESLGAAALRIAGGIFTKIADIGADLMKIVFKIKETTPGTPASSRTARDNAGDSVGPRRTGSRRTE